MSKQNKLEIEDNYEAVRLFDSWINDMIDFGQIHSTLSKNDFMKNNFRDEQCVTTVLTRNDGSTKTFKFISKPLVHAVHFKDSLFNEAAHKYIVIFGE
jgi:hypothetical protein